MLVPSLPSDLDVVSRVRRLGIMKERKIVLWGVLFSCNRGVSNRPRICMPLLVGDDETNF